MSGGGILSFTLGLGTGTFIGPLAEADSKLKGFLATTVGVAAILEGVQKKMEQGVGLKHLSDVTQVGIASIYGLQRGLEEVGGSADAAGSLLFNLQKSLGGVNDNGEPTAFVFSQIGLSIEDLKKMGAPQVLMAVADQVNRLDSASATNVAGKIFGKFNAAEFLKIARNTEDFSDALRRAGTQGAIFDRFSRTFDTIETLVGDLKENFSGVFLGLAAGVAPALENILKMTNEIDFSKIGQWIGTFVTALTQAFREGTLSDLIGDSLKLGFDTLLAYAPGVFEKAGFFLVKAFETPLEYIQAGMEYALEAAAHSFANSPFLQGFLGVLNPSAAAGLRAIGDTGAPDWQKIIADEKKNGPIFNLGSGDFNAGDISKDADESLASAKASMQQKWKDFGAELIGLAGRAAQPDAAKKAAAGATDTLGAGYRPEHTALEKLGFVFRGGASTDPNTQTARNTSRMVSLLQGIHQKMSGGEGGAFGDSLTNTFVS